MKIKVFLEKPLINLGPLWVDKILDMVIHEKDVWYELSYWTQTGKKFNEVCLKYLLLECISDHLIDFQRTARSWSRVNDSNVCHQGHTAWTKILWYTYILT